MKALIVYESMYGNTQSIAKAIADGVSSHMDVDLFEVGEAPKIPPPDVTLLILGAPTHQFGMSRPSSREQAITRGNLRLVSSGIGMREWLDATPGGSDTIAAAVFCTVLEKPRFLRYFGTAGTRIAKRLRRLGFRLIAPPENFWVEGSTGPLRTDEESRAHQWGAEVASRLTAEVLHAV